MADDEEVLPDPGLDDEPTPAPFVGHNTRSNENG